MYQGNTMMTWTRGDIFSDLPMRKPPRDSAYHLGPSKIMYSMLNIYIFQAQDSAAWLQELRPRYAAGYTLVAYQSQQTVAKTVLKQQCTITSCSGCSTGRLRLLCAAAQDCALSRCIGTVVQTRNVLCGIGGVMEQTSLHGIVTWRAIYGASIEVSLLAMRGMSGEIISHVTLRFPTDQFYALVCSCKVGASDGLVLVHLILDVPGHVRQVRGAQHQPGQDDGAVEHHRFGPHGDAGCGRARRGGWCI